MNPAFFSFVAGDAVSDFALALSWRDSVGRDSESSGFSEVELEVAVGFVGAGCRSAGW